MDGPLDPRALGLPERLLALKEELWRGECRRSLLAFSIHALHQQGLRPARHHRRIIAELETVARGDVRRLMVLAPPGSAKTTYVSRLYPAWRLAVPGLNVIGTSHTAELSETNSIYAQRHIREHEAQLGYGLRSEGRANWESTNGGRYRAVGAITGFRADVILIDDPVRGREEAESLVQRERVWDWFNADLLTRLKPAGAVVLVMTRWHEDDLAGRLLRSEAERWHVLRLPAIAEADDPLGRVLGEPLWNDGADYGYGTRLLAIQVEMERAGRQRDWHALYQGSPRPPEGAMFKTGNMPIYASIPSNWQRVRTVRGWDFAASSGRGDYTCGAKVAQFLDRVLLTDHWVVMDMQREQASPEDALRLLLTTAEVDGATVTQVLPEDPGAAGRFAAEDMVRRLAGLPVVTERITGSKESMARPLAAQANVGNVGMLQAPWVQALIAELASFPSGVHDDQCDAISLAFSQLSGNDITIWARM